LADREITLEMKRPEIIVLLFFVATIFLMELQVTFNTPISFGDEGFHTRMSQWIAQNGEYPVWVPFVRNAVWKTSYSRQPFWNILEASFFFILGFNEAIVKFLVPFISLMTGITVYFIGKEFYNKRIGLMASAILVTLPSFVTYSVLFYTDALVTLFTSMFMLTFLMALKTGKKLHMLAAGSFGALMFMTKLTGYTSYVMVFLVFMYYFVKGKKLGFLIKKYSPLLLMMIIIPGMFFVRSYRYYGTPVCHGIPIISSITDRLFNYDGCRVSTYESEHSYEGRTEQVGTESGVFRFGITNYMVFAYGNVWFIVFGLFAGIFVIAGRVVKADRVKMADMFLLFMMLIFAVLFLTITKRAEDTSRFSLMWTPIISLIAANYFDEVYKFIKAYQRHIALGVLVVVLFASLNNSMLASKGTPSKISQLIPIKQFSPSFFEACDWIKENVPEDALLSTVWTYRTAYSCERDSTGNEPDIMLSDNIDDMLEAAENLGVTHIFVQKFSLSNSALSEKFLINSVKIFEANPDVFENIYENGPPMSQCIQQGGCDGNTLYQINFD